MNRGQPCQGLAFINNSSIIIRYCGECDPISSFSQSKTLRLAAQVS